jgi:UDP-N-acetylglucosamine--N-acetylmuramyl-(pentapeptide) pyrophosphoryl-undecaprenol N-acetylglucosamine transferase
MVTWRFIEACIANERRATTGSPDPRTFRLESPNIGCAGINKTTHPTEIVFTGGGTGGHLFPGLAVAAELAEGAPGLRITFAGTGKQLEQQAVRAAGFGYVAVPCRPLPRRPGDALRFLIDSIAGYRAALRLLRSRPVAVVVGLGGYGCVPVARAAVRHKVPLVLLEQNATLGRATRWLARWATVVCTAFEHTAVPPERGRALQVTGNPVRRGFVQERLGQGRGKADGSSRQLLVVGGSSGARTLNQYVPRVLGNLRPRLSGWEVLHQSGPVEWEATKGAYASLGIRADVVPFVDDMPALMARADLAVCRAGGTTLAELAASGLPAVLLPYPYAAGNHQRTNADVFSSAGGCVTVDERDWKGCLEEHLTGTISTLLADGTRRAAMSRAIARLARPDAARDVAALVADLAGRRGRPD